MDAQLKAELKQSIEASIRRFFQRRKVKVTHVLDRIFPVERRIRSLIGGLETSMGTTVWEPVAKVLAKANDFTIEDRKLLMPEPFPQVLSEAIDKLRRLRESKSTWISMGECVEQMRNAAQRIDRSNLSYIAPPAGKGVDVYLSKDGIEYAFDIKTVQPNQGDGLKFNLQLLEWYAYRLCQDPSANFEARIAFPFNPYPDDWWNHQGKRAYPLEKRKDAWVQDEFWDFCSGHSNTWVDILHVFEQLGQENFGNQFNDIFYPR
jgi:hypothetical protein